MILAIYIIIQLCYYISQLLYEFSIIFVQRHLNDSKNLEYRLSLVLAHPLSLHHSFLFDTATLPWLCKVVKFGVRKECRSDWSPHNKPSFSRNHFHWIFYISIRVSFSSRCTQTTCSATYYHRSGYVVSR